MGFAALYPSYECDFAFSRRIAPEVCVLHRPSRNRGRREDRVRAAPAVSCAIAHRKRAHEHTGSAGASRPSLRSGFTAYFVLSPVNGFLATVALAAIACRKNLTPAPGCQDHTTSPYAAALFVGAYRAQHCGVHRVPRPTFQTIMTRPSCGHGISDI